MKHIGELIRERYSLGVLSTGTLALYKTPGWERWRGPTFVDGPSGRKRTPGRRWRCHDPPNTALTAS